MAKLTLRYEYSESPQSYSSHLFIMLQIISGKFFGDGDINEQDGQAVLFSNYAWMPQQDIASQVVTLQATSYSRSLTSYVLRYTNRYEKQSDTDILVMPSDTSIIKQAKLLASFYFRAMFNEDRPYLEHLTRQRSKQSTDTFVPHQFAPRWFDHHIHGNAEEVAGFGAFVNEAIGLQRKDYLVLISCLEVFVDALESVSTNFDLAYSMLVYLLETISSHLDKYEPVWEDYDQDMKGKLDRELATIETNTAQRIRDNLLSGRQLRLTRRFVMGISELVNECFYESDALALDRPIPQSDMQQALRNLYASRSQFVHSLKKLHKQLTMPGMQMSDIFVWNNQPNFTLSGLIRLTTHVLRSFVSRRQKVDSEAYSTWRSELPGMIQAKMAPQYWIWRSEGIVPSHANKKFNGFFEFITSEIGKNDFALVHLEDLLKAIEPLFEQCNEEQKWSFYAVYATYGLMMVPAGKPDTADAFIERRWESMSRKCSVQMMSAYLVLNEVFPWKVGDCAATFDIYMQRKYKPKALNVPRKLEVALRLEIAKAYHHSGDMTNFTEWSKLTIPEAAGDHDLQERIKASIEKSSPLEGRHVLCSSSEHKDHGMVILWRLDSPPETVEDGATIRFAFDQPFMLRWTGDAWKSQADIYSVICDDHGAFVLDVAVRDEGSSPLEFTLFWIGSQNWEGRNYTVAIQKKSSSEGNKQ